MAHPNPNTLNYWLRNGTVLPPYALGKVSGTADMDYWDRDGTVLFPAAIQAPVVSAILPPERPVILLQAVNRAATW